MSVFASDFGNGFHSHRAFEVSMQLNFGQRV
jgi:hypothetical protein